MWLWKQICNIRSRAVGATTTPESTSGAWRDCIQGKRNVGFRCRGIGRALFIFDLARRGCHAQRRISVPCAGREQLGR